jgi:D-alanine-D-alanine ligase
MKPLRILMLIEKGLVPPDSIEGMSAEDVAPFKTEWHVFSTLRDAGHEVMKLAVWDDVGAVVGAVKGFKPDVAFNLLEGFRGFHGFDQHIVAHLELLEQCYTGCNPRGLVLARDKALTKKIMAYHRIRCPAFGVFPRGRKVKRAKDLPFPLLVKSVNVEGSCGIAQASIVHDDAQLAERVQFIHDATNTTAIAEQFIDGRELYVGVMGNEKLKVLPVWEMLFENVPDDRPKIATDRAKWSPAYQKRWGITTREAKDLPEGVAQKLPALCKRIYRILGLTGYARLDFRMTESGDLYLLEANPNPQIAMDEDFADSAKAIGMKYDALLTEIIQLGLRYRPENLA